MGSKERPSAPEVNIWGLLRRADGFFSAATRVLTMSLALELVALTIPIGFQLVVDEVVVSNDRDLLMLIAVGLGLMLALRAFIDLVRSWAMAGRQREVSRCSGR